MPGADRRLAVVCAAVFMLAVVIGCSGREIDLQKELQVVDFTSGWFDAGIVDGKNKLVPTVSFKLKNDAAVTVNTVQVNVVFRRVNEEEEWSSAYTRAVGSSGLAPGEATAVLTLRSQLGYTGIQPRAEMLGHESFQDAKATVFAKYGSGQWILLGEYSIERLLLTR